MLITTPSAPLDQCVRRALSSLACGLGAPAGLLLLLLPIGCLA